MKRRETNTPTGHAFMVISTPDSTAVNSGELPRSNQARQTSAALSATPSVILMSVESSHQKSSDASLHDSPISSNQHSYPLNDSEVSVLRAPETDFGSSQAEQDDVNSLVQYPHDAVFTSDSAVINVAELPQPNQIRDSSDPSAPPPMSALPAAPSMIIVRIRSSLSSE